VEDADFIKFKCTHCGGKMRVPKIHAGKKGRCPVCKQAITIPHESASIELKCKNCGLTISVPILHAGKEGFCPKCKNPILIPRPGDEFNDEQSDTEEPNKHLVGNAGSLTLLDVPEEYKLKDEPEDLPQTPVTTIAQEPETIKKTETQEHVPPGHRRLPWFIDIFLYPVSMSGLMHLIMFTLLPPVIFLLSIFGCTMALISLMMIIALGLYMLWFFNECVRDSAKGGIRAPEAFATAGLGEMWSEAKYIISCFVIFMLPFFLYFLTTKRVDNIFWLLLFYDVVFFPMGLLSTIMFDSLHGLNPILLISSIFSTFFQYAGLVLLLGGIILAFGYLMNITMTGENRSYLDSLLYRALSIFLILYMTLILAHLIGRFYWRNQEKLNWEV
jgi:DNA-directed RNA polymerase subunit RPC12/RpoP